MAENLGTRALQGMYDFYKPISDTVGMGVDYAKNEGSNMYRDFKKIFPPYAPNVKANNLGGLNQEDVDRYYKDYLQGIPTTQWAELIANLKLMDAQAGQ